MGVFEHAHSNVFALLKTEDRVMHMELSQFFQTAQIKEAHASESELERVLSSVMEAVWPVIDDGACTTERNIPKNVPPPKPATPQPAVTEPLKSLSAKQLQAAEKKKVDSEKKAAAAAAVIIHLPRVRKPTSVPAPVSAPIVKAKGAGVGATIRRGKQAKSKHKTSTCFNINNAKTLTINRR